MTPARGQGVFLCMLGLACASLAGQLAPKPGRPAALPGVPRAAARQTAPGVARAGGPYLADIDGRLLPSPHPPTGETLSLSVAGELRRVRAVRLDVADRRAPYYLADDGRLLETEWRWVDGTIEASVRCRRGMLEVPSPG